MNRTIIILLIFVLLGGISFYLTQTQSGTKQTTLSNNDWDMAVEDLSSIHKVFVADRKGNTVKIERKNGYWLYNDKFRARPNAVDVMLDAIRRVRLRNRPSNAAIDGMIKTVASEGIKVEIYNKEGENMKTFYVGGVTQDERGTYMMMADSDNPYVMHIPEWEGSIRGRFFFGDKNWRDKTVIQEQVEAIEAVTVVYPNKRNKSFVLKKEGRDYTVKPYYDTTPPITNAVNQSAVEAYLIGFEKLGAEAFENLNPLRDSISALQPFTIVTIENNKGESKTLKFHPIIDRDENGLPLPNRTVERYLVDSSTDDFYLIQHIVFGKILWAYEYFFEKQPSN